MNAETKSTPKAPLITVAMPVYNGGAYLAAAVASIVGQTYPHWQLMLVDDGSTDGAIDALPMLADARIHVLRDGRNLGLAARLNQILEQAQGDFIARMDGDDISHPERFARQVQALQQHPDVDLVATRCRTISSNGKLLGHLPFMGTHQEICDTPWKGFYMPHPSWMGRLTWFRRYRYLDPAPYCCEDQELLLRSYASSTFMALPEELLDYRVRDVLVWRKSWRTRSALEQLQVRHFAQQRQYSYMLLAFLSRLGRHVKDAVQLMRAV